MSVSPIVSIVRSAPESGPTPRASHNVALDYLRTFAVLLVLAHHASLAYFPAIPPVKTASLLPQPRWWKAFPILDTERWVGFAIFVGFNDTFFMTLLFFLSGLFVSSSLERKGARTFFRDRMVRLGIPFVFVAAIIAPLAYYPAYAIRSGNPSVAGFTRQWLALGEWPTGPGWFVWLLLLFDSAAAALFVLSPRFAARLGNLSSSANRHPARLFLLLCVTATCAYAPMVIRFGQDHWTSFGPFQFQTSRMLHYAVYFLIGVGVGAHGIDRGLLAPDGSLARHWLRWTIAMPLAFALLASFAVKMPSLSPGVSPTTLRCLYAPLFELSCVASCFGLLALFVRFVKRRNPLLDGLSENAYGIYLVHYAFVSWLGYALMAVRLPAVGKFALVFGCVVALSWAASAAARRMPAVARVV